MKKTTLSIATALALVLGAAGTAAAHDRCLDEACSLVALVDAGDAGTAGGDVAAIRYGTWGIDTAGMDTTVAPGADFFRYVSGNWAANTEIPADKSMYGSFLVLRDLSEARVHGLVEGYVAQGDAATGDAAKVAALYRGFMDEAAIEALGPKPLAPHLAAIRAAADREAIADLMGRSAGAPGVTLFRMMVSDDQLDPDRYTLYMSQSGLGLGDRELYLDGKFEPQRERYVAYIARMLELAGWDDPKGNAQRVFDFEKAVAEAHWTRAESRDRSRTYNPVERADFASTAPGFPWDRYFAAAGLDQATRAVVRQDTAMPKLAAIFAATELDTLKAWQAFHVTDEAAPLLSKDFVDANFDFRSKFMSGQPQQRERWKRAVAQAERAMGEAIGRDYVAHYFPPASKAKMDELVANVKAAMGARLDQLEWMGDETKAEARAKLAGFGLKIGHPETWRDYSALEIREGDVLGNALRSAAFEWDYRRARLGQQVDKAEWGMTPQTVNAYYNSVKNEIVFPAAILQPPFFDPDADAAVNYGGIGAVIGHEIIHGFDDQGRKSDGAGLLRDWWTAEDAAQFEAQAAKLGAQYEAFEFPQLPGLHINPKASMGENIGDLGGVTIALEAYRRSRDAQEAGVIDGFTPEQRFFLGWAQVWRTLFRDEALRQQLVGNSHSPGQIRAFAPLRNVDAWYEAFEVTEDDALWIAPEDRVRIW